MSKIKISPTQVEILTMAAERPGGHIEPLPTRLPKGIQPNVLNALVSRGWVEETDDGFVITDSGRAAVNMPAQKAEVVDTISPDSHSDNEELTENNVQNGHESQADDGAPTDNESEELTESETRPIVNKKPLREGTIQKLILDLIARENGATIDELVDATKWQAHTVRATISRTLRKERRYNISLDKETDRRCYTLKP